jgi:hypothetical protein
MLDRSALISISTLYDTRCGLCNRPISQGTPVLWDRPERKVYHYSCIGTSEIHRTITLDDDVFSVKFEDSNFYLETLLNQIAGAEKVEGEWIVTSHPISAKQLLDLAEQHSFEYDAEVLDRLTDLIRAGTESMLQSMARSSSFIVNGLRHQPFPFQQSGIEFGINNKHVIIADQMGLGKGLAHGTPVLTPSGWKSIEDLAVGDTVTGKDGTGYTINGVFPQGNLECYKVTFNDRTSVVVDADHLWTVKHVRNGGKWRVKRTSEIQESIKDSSGNLTWRIPLVEPVQFNSQPPLPIDPYFLGLLLGDGGLSTNTVKFTNEDRELIRAVKSFAKSWNLTSRKINRLDYCLVNKTRGKANYLRRTLTALGLKCKSTHKFIPSCYLTASPRDRLKLIRGLMDTDGHASLDGTNEFSSSSPQLIRNIAELVQSLGGVARISNHRVNIKLNVCPFWLTRKAKNWLPPTEYKPSRIIKSIESVGKRQVTCIAVDVEDQLFVTDQYIVTHNTIQAMGIIAHMRLFPAVIVCPAIIKLNWYRELIEWVTELESETIWTLQSKTSHLLPPAKVYIINYDILASWVTSIKRIKPRVIIYDEFHYCKTSQSLRGKAARELAKDVEYVIGLTGTPILNRPEELIHPLRILGRLGEMGGKDYVEKRYCDAKQDRFKRWDTSGASNLEELNQRLRSGGIFIRRTKAQVLPDLPKKLPPTVIRIPLTNTQEYRKAERDLAAWLGEKAVEDEHFKKSIQHLSVLDQLRVTSTRRRSVEYLARRNEERSKFIYLKRLATQGKLQGIKEYINNFLENGEKLLVFGWFVDTQVDLSQSWPQAVHVLGQDSDKQRMWAIDKFQNDPKCKLLIASLKVLGIGVNLTAASHVAFVELGWTPADHDQAEDRVHRIGQTMPVNVYYFISEDTIETDIIEIIDSKRRVIGAATDGVGANDQEIISLLIGRLLKKYGKQK